MRESVSTLRPIQTGTHSAHRLENCSTEYIVFTSIKWLNAASFIKLESLRTALSSISFSSWIFSMLHPRRIGMTCNNSSSFPLNIFKAVCYQVNVTYQNASTWHSYQLEFWHSKNLCIANKTENVWSNM